MGSVASDVGNFVSDTVDSVGDIGQSVIDAGTSVVDSVGSVVSDATQTVSDAFAQIDPGPVIGQAGAAVDQVVNDVIPGGWATVGAIAATVATVGAAAETIPEAIAVGEAATTGVAATESVAATTAAAYDAGWSATGSLASTAGTTASTTAANAAANAIVEAAATGAAKGAAIGAAKSALTGGDIIDGALTGAVTGAVGAGVGNYASGLTTGTDLADYAKTVGTIAGGTAAGATGAAMSDRDPITGALIGGITGGTSSIASDIMPTDINQAVTSAGLGAIKAGLTGGDPIMGALTSAGGSLVNQGVGGAYDAIKSGLSSNDTTTPTTPTTQTADITQDSNYKAAIDAGFNPQEATALAQGALDPNLPAYNPLAANSDGSSVSVTSMNDVPIPLTPLVKAPEETGTTTLTNPDGSTTTYDNETGKEIATQLPTSPLDTALTSIIDSSSGVTNTGGGLSLASNNSITTDNTGSSGGGGGGGSGGSGGSGGDGSGGGGDGSGGGGGGSGTDGTGLGGTGSGGGGGGSGGGGGGTGTGVTTATGGLNYTKPSNQNVYDGLTNLTPGLTQSMTNYNLTGLPSVLKQFATGGSAQSSSSSLFDSKGNYNYTNTSDSQLTPTLTKHNVSYTLEGLPVLNKADGGSIHNPEFYSEGGASMANRYVKGKGDGTSDSIPAMLANGEFVIPADVVSSLGNGSNDSGAKVLDEFLRVIRDHKRKADAKHLPPDSKGPLSYLTDAKRKVRK